VAGFFVRGRIRVMKYRNLRIAYSMAWFLIAAVLIAICFYRQYLFENYPHGLSPAMRRPLYSDYFGYARMSCYAAGIGFLTLIRLPRRFTIRTLLVVTTLIAIALGLIVWAFRAR
jgi:hypothetical protein